MTSYLNKGYDVIKCFAKFEKFLPHGITMQSFLSVGSQMPELERGLPPSYKIGSQNTPHKLGLNCFRDASFLPGNFSCWDPCKLCSPFHWPV